MVRIAYSFIYGLCWLLTRLPLKFLYLKSDFLYFLIYYLVGYRKNLTISNLTSAFPGKDEKEIKVIARTFYRHLADYFVESVYLLGLSEKEAGKRYVFKNPSLLEEYYKQGKSVVLVLPHYGNWEWLATAPTILSHKVLGIYKPIANKAHNRLFIKLRCRFGVETVPMKQSFRRILELQSQGVPTLSLFLYDQRPLWNELHHWVPFLNRDIPVLQGAEKIAGKTGQAVVFMKSRKVKRGYYENEFIPMYADGKTIPANEMTDKFWKILEEMILEEPAYWLWSHNRWKFTKPE